MGEAEDSQSGADREGTVMRRSGGRQGEGRAVAIACEDALILKLSLPFREKISLFLLAVMIGSTSADWKTTAVARGRRRELGKASAQAQFRRPLA